jgi:glycosyltransferase involved in cell wall biosynthesis
MPIENRSNAPVPGFVVQLAGSLPIGGMENVVASLAQRLQRHATAVWCLEESGATGDRLRAAGVALEVLGRRAQRDVSLIVRLARRLRQQRVGVLHCHDELSWFYGTAAAHLAGGIPTLVTMHGRRPGISLRHLIEQRALTAFSRVVVVSDYLEEQIRRELRLAPGCLRVIRNGIPLPPRATEAARRAARAALGLPLTDFVIGSVAVLAPVKNFALALDAFAAARGRAHRSLRLLLVGDGPLRADLSEQARRLGVAPWVTFAGHRNDVAELLPGLDAYVSSSNYEGISLSILEAMASARPVIATRVGGNPEIVIHGQTGIVVPPGDVDALRDGFLSLLDNCDEAAQMGLRAETLARTDYSVERMVAEYEDLYATLRRPQS